MLRVHAPGALAVHGHGNVTVRTEDIYLLPRLDGSVVIGATIEDAGFDVSTSDADIARLRARAAELLPALAAAPELERWAGLRPDTPDHLPVIGRTGEHSWGCRRPLSQRRVARARHCGHGCSVDPRRGTCGRRQRI